MKLRVVIVNYKTAPLALRAAEGALVDVNALGGAITIVDNDSGDGSLATLEAVVEHYDHGGVDRPSRSDLMRPLGLTAQEKADLVAFMKTLDSNLSPTAVPVLPR